MPKKNIVIARINPSDNGLGGPKQQQHLIGRRGINWNQIAADESICNGELTIYAGLRDGHHCTLRGPVIRIELQPTKSLALLHMQWLAIGREFTNILHGYPGHTADSDWAEYLGPIPMIGADYITYYTMCPGEQHMLLELGDSCNILPKGHGPHLRYEEVLPVWNSWLTPVNKKTGLAIPALT